MNEPADNSDEREERLALLVEELLAGLRRGTEPDFAQIDRDHPDLADEVRELLATARLAEEFAGHSRTPTFVPAPRPAASTPPSDAIGDYELLEELGRGGMGVVYKARQRSLGRTVALKMILDGTAAGDLDRQRFRQEAEAAASLSHPHIVPVYEVGESDGHPFFSMRFIPGETLSARLQAGPVPPAQAVAWMIDLCDAVAAAHEQGILHRDLKPSNILLDEHDVPYITDFGLAKQFDRQDRSLTESGAILGTPGYLSPEQASGRRNAVGPAGDIYSLGAVLYALLTGRPPFQGATPVQTVMMVLEQEPIPPRVLNPGVDSDLELIALKCLQKPVELRYRTVRDLARDLRAWQEREPISARSSRFRDILNRAFRESPHAVILENWGLLWIWHALVLLALCLMTNVMQLARVTDRWPYVVLWTIGLGIWAATFWNLRRRAGPITFVERQIAHVWAGSMLASSLLFAVEGLLGLPVLSLSPALGLIGGMVFLAKAGILSGQFYFQAGLLFLTGLVMAWLPHSTLPQCGISLFGIASAIGFAIPGWQYHRQRRARILRDE